MACRQLMELQPRPASRNQYRCHPAKIFWPEPTFRRWTRRVEILEKVRYCEPQYRQHQHRRRASLRHGRDILLNRSWLGSCRLLLQFLFELLDFRRDYSAAIRLVGMRPEIILM